MNVIYFYGHSEREPYNYMSNFYQSPFVDQHGNRYFCSEQYFMKKKQELFDPNNEELALSIMKSNNPDVVKSLGRKVKNFNEDLWNHHKYRIMCEALMNKFTQNENLRRKLLDTEYSILAEASPTDKVWGIGMNKKDAEKTTMDKWKGQNLLGKALMLTREQLRRC